MIKEVSEQYQRIDFLMNNAAILRDRTLAKMTIEEWEAVIEVNLSGVFYCCKFGLEIMNDGGAIVTLGSIAAIQGFYGQANDAAAKADVIAMTRVISRQVARRWIRANAIAPGVTQTSIAATIPVHVRTEMLKNVPLARFGKTSDVANVALFCALLLRLTSLDRPLKSTEDERDERCGADSQRPRNRCRDSHRSYNCSWWIRWSGPSGAPLDSDEIENFYSQASLRS